MEMQLMMDVFSFGGTFWKCTFAYRLYSWSVAPFLKGAVQSIQFHPKRVVVTPSPNAGPPSVELVSRPTIEN